MRTIGALFILLSFFCSSLSSATEIEYEVHPEWRMLVCAGFGYQLTFNNDNRTFSLRFGSECENVIHPAYKGTFKANQNSVVLDFGDIKAHYNLKMPYSEICGSGEPVSKEEEQIICDNTQLLRGNDAFPGGNDKNVYLKTPALFPSKFEGIAQSETARDLLQDLRGHSFLAILEE